MLETGAGRVAARGGVSGASGGVGAHRQLGCLLCQVSTVREKARDTRGGCEVSPSLTLLTSSSSSALSFRLELWT